MAAQNRCTRIAVCIPTARSTSWSQPPPEVRLAGPQVALLSIVNRLLPLLLLAISCTGQMEGPASETVARKTSATTVARPLPEAPVRTDRSAYKLSDGARGPEATIVATLRAPKDRSLYIVNCNGATGLTLQRRVDTEWVPAWLITMNACLSPPIVVPHGGEHTGQLYLHEHSGAVLHPARARMIESGTYRVVWTGVLTSFDPNVEGFGPELPLEQRASAPFTIEVPSLPSPAADAAGDAESKATR